MDVQRRSNSQFLLHGVIGGIIAGIVFAMADMVMAVVVMGASFFAPLRMIGAMVLGAGALDESYPLVQAAAAGIIVHMMLSAVFGVIFVYLLALARQLGASTGLLLLYGFVFGVALWVVNFLIIAPIAFPWFAMVNQFWLGFVAHAVFYGIVIGGYVAVTRPGRAAT